MIRACTPHTFLAIVATVQLTRVLQLTQLANPNRTMKA